MTISKIACTYYGGIIMKNLLQDIKTIGVIKFIILVSIGLFLGYLIDILVDTITGYSIRELARELSHYIRTLF